MNPKPQQQRVFPGMKRHWSKLFFVPDGWQDLGKVGSYSSEGRNVHDVCAMCCKKLRIGCEPDGTRFRYCPICFSKKNAG